MSDDWIGQAFNCMVIVLVGVGLLAWYRRRVARLAERQDFQYRLFALRDRAIRLVAEGVIEEDDRQWQTLYRHLNESARSFTVERMRNGLSFVLGVLDKLEPPTPEDIREFNRLPRPLKRLWMDFANTVLNICWEGSTILRTVVRAAHRYRRVKQFVEQLRPTETKLYRAWERSQHHFASCM